MQCESFGECFEFCLEQAAAGVRFSESPVFTEVLRMAAKEWGEIAWSLNGGNDRGYNLCRAGNAIERISVVCSDPVTAERQETDWGRVLFDVREISRIVRHELTRNVRQKRARDADYIDCGKRYATGDCLETQT